MNFLFFLISFLFLFINYKILEFDIYFKKIPNKFLLYLLTLIPFYYFIMFSSYEINIINFIGLIGIAFVISFILFYFGIWSGGNAKYLLVLALFLPTTGIIVFIGNIAIITILYLILYFFRFYLGKGILTKGHFKYIILNVKKDLLDRWKFYKQKKGGKSVYIFTKWIIIFLIIFVSIRLCRFYFLNLFVNEGNNYELSKYFIENYSFYLFLIFIITFILFLYIIKIIINKVKNFISKKLSLDIEKVGNFSIILLGIILISFIGIEYYLKKEELISILIQIFTLYLTIYIIIKILLYSYKITFNYSEIIIININKLKKGDIIDKTYLIKMFGEQYPLLNNNKIIKKMKYPNPTEYFRNIQNPINEKTVVLLKEIFSSTINYHKKNNSISFSENNSIKILKTFSFSPYIFLGFIISFTYGKNLINDIIYYLLETITKKIL